MIYRLRLFGYVVASLECEDVEALPDGIGGGSMHSFERDEHPFDPTDRGDYEDRFGFQ